MAVSSNDGAFQFEDRGSHARIVFRPALNDEWTRVHEYGDVMIERVRSASSARLLLDLGELETCGSAVVAVMVNLWKEVRTRGGVFSVYCPSRGVRETLSISRLTDVWEVHDNREDAEEAVLQGYTRSQARDRKGMGWLALLGLAALVGMVAIAVLQRSFGMLPAACGTVGIASLALAALVWRDLSWAVALARGWAVCVALVALLAVGFELGHAGLLWWHKLAAACALLLVVGLCASVWAALRPSADSASE